MAYSGKKQADSYELVTWITCLSCSAAYGTVNLQNFTSDKWRVATTADWSYRCSTFLILASFRTTELWPSAPICKTKRYKATSSAAPKKANIPVYKPQSACTHFLFIQEKKKIPQNQKRWPLLLLFNSAWSSCIRYRKAYAPWSTASLTELATHLTWALHVGGAAHTESEPNPVERTWARGDAWSTEMKSLVTSSLVWSLRPSANSICTQGLVSQLWEGRGQVYPTALLP